MKGNFVFWAQALDNSSPDHVNVGGGDLLPNDNERRQKAVSSVSHVVKVGSRIFDEAGILLVIDDKHFVLEILSLQCDNAGRAAPIVCYGNYEVTNNDILWKSVADGLDKFAKQIGRDVMPEHRDLIYKSFSVLEKELSRRKKKFVIFVCGIIMVVLLLLIISFLYTQ